MNETERRRLIIGIIVFVALVGAVVAILWAQRSGITEGEYILITELGADTKIQPGTFVFIGGQKVGVVGKVTAVPERAALAVRMWIRPDVFRRIGDDATVQARQAASGETILEINPGTKANSQRFIKIKAIRGIR